MATVEKWDYPFCRENGRCDIFSWRWIFKQCMCCQPASKASFCSLEWVEKKAPPESHQAFEFAKAQASGVWTSQSCSLSSNWFSWCEHRLLIKPMVITEPAVPSARLLGLGLKQYPRNEQRILNNDLTRFVQSLSRVRQNREMKERGLKARSSCVLKGDGLSQTRYYLLSCPRTY